MTAPSRRRRRADARPSWNAAELPARHVTSVSRKRPLEKDRVRYGRRSGPMRNETALNLNDPIKKDTKYYYHIAGDFLEGQIQVNFKFFGHWQILIWQIGGHVSLSISIVHQIHVGGFIYNKIAQFVKIFLH